MKTKTRSRPEVGRRKKNPASYALLPSSSKILNRATERLAHIEHGRLTAEVLLAHILRLTRTQLLSRPELNVSSKEKAEYDRLIKRAAAGEPLAYLGGHREFYGLDFLVDPRVLVPRHETELLVDWALRFTAEFAERAETAEKNSANSASSAVSILDVGTGSGCIAVTLAVKLPNAQVTAIDISGDALAVAWANAERHGVADRVGFIQSDLLSDLRPLTSNFQLVTANLPYIASAELKRLPVSKHEPRLALDGGPDGLALIRRLLADAPRVMTPAGQLLLEIGDTQGRAAAALARAAFPAAKVTVHQDWAGLDRVVEIAL